MPFKVVTGLSGGFVGNWKMFSLNVLITICQAKSASSIMLTQAITLLDYLCSISDVAILKRRHSLPIQFIHKRWSEAVPILLIHFRLWFLSITTSLKPQSKRTSNATANAIFATPRFVMSCCVCQMHLNAIN